MPMTKSQRQQRSRIGGFALAASRDPKQYTKPARRGFMRRFLDEVDANRELPEAERERRATAALRGYMTRLALRSAQKRGNGSG